MARGRFFGVFMPSHEQKQFERGKYIQISVFVLSLPLSQSQDDDSVRLKWKRNGQQGKCFQLTAG